MDVNAARKDDKKTIITGNIIPDFTVDGDVVVSGILDTKQEVLCLKYTADLEFLSAGFTDGFVRLFKPDKGQCIYSLIDEEILKNPVPVTCIKHKRLQKNKPAPKSLLCSYVNGCVKSWNYSTGECEYTIHESRQTLGLAYCPKMSKFVSVGDDGKVILYDEERRHQERVYRSSESPEAVDGHSSRVYAACFHPKNPHEFITGGWDDIVLYWDIRQPAATHHLSGVHICGEGLDINPSGKEVLTCAWQKTNQLQIWNYSSTRVLKDLHPDAKESMLYCGKWITNNILTAGGSDANLFRIVDANQGITTASIKDLPKGVYSIDIGPMKPRQSQAKKANPKYSSEPAELPKIAFCAGRRIYELFFK